MDKKKGNEESFCAIGEGRNWRRSSEKKGGSDWEK